MDRADITSEIDVKSCRATFDLPDKEFSRQLISTYQEKPFHIFEEVPHLPNHKGEVYCIGLSKNLQPPKNALQ